MRNREVLDTPETHGSSAKQACLNHHLMALQTRRQLLPLAAQGADEDKLNVIVEELDLDPDADEDNSDLNMLDSDDDGNLSFVTTRLFIVCDPIFSTSSGCGKFQTYCPCKETTG